MGICLSSESLERQESDENIVYVVGDDDDDERYDGDRVRKMASLYSQQGKKGPNQDSAILCQGFGLEEGVFCGVFDGHGRNGHIVSRLVRDYLPSLLLSQRNVLLAADETYNFIDGNDMSSIDSDDCTVSSPEMFDEWKEACISAFRAMDKELKLHPDLDSSYSGTTAVTIIKQVWDVLSNEQVVSIVWSVGSKVEASKAIVKAAVRVWRRKFPSSRVDDCSAACLFLQ